MTSDRSRSFDDLVEQANDWLENPPSFGRGLKHFLQGFLSPFGFKTNGMGHPIYDNDELTPEQKDAIMLASDVRRTDRYIDGIKSKGAKEMLKAAQENLYNAYKSMF